MLNLLTVTSLPIYLPNNQVPAEFGEPLTDVTLTNPSAAPIVVTAPGYLPTAGDLVAISVGQGGNIPASTLTVGTPYFVIAPSTDTFEVSATLGGGAINGTGTGAFSGITLHILDAQNAQAVPYSLKPLNTVLMFAFAAATLQSAPDVQTGFGDPQGPGSFTTIATLAAAGVISAVLNQDWIKASAGTAYLVGA